MRFGDSGYQRAGAEPRKFEDFRVAVWVRLFGGDAASPFQSEHHWLSGHAKCVESGIHELVGPKLESVLRPSMT